jgi:hypothetical protein
MQDETEDQGLWDCRLRNGCIYLLATTFNTLEAEIHKMEINWTNNESIVFGPIAFLIEYCKW